VFKKKVLLIVALFVLVVFGASGVYALLTPTLRLTASMVKARFEMGEPVNITITLQNIGLWPLTFTYDSPLLDFVVYNEASENIFRYGSIILIRPGDVLPITLWPIQTIAKTLAWDQEGYGEGEGLYKVPKGSYTIVAMTTVIHINRIFVLEAQSITVTIDE